MLGQIKQQPTAAFLCTRNRTRPFLYFPKNDVCLSTLRSYAWTYDSRIGLRASILTSLVLSHKWTDVGDDVLPHVPTNFCAAWNLKSSNSIPSVYAISSKEEKTTNELLESEDSEDEYISADSGEDDDHKDTFDNVAAGVRKRTKSTGNAVPITKYLKLGLDT